LLQLNLVLMGGSRIPEYRRMLMPGLSATVLLMGATTLFLDTPYIYGVWGLACCVHSVQMFFNNLQIIEHSGGVESLLTGDSEFRKATIIMMLTWLPFPGWYILSPEGLGLITNITVVQLGWAFLNVTAKFGLIFYIQRVKDNYCNRLKVTREMKGALNNVYSADDDGEEGIDGGKAGLKGELSACVQQTMSDLGMAYNFERFMTLLREAGVSSLDEIAKMTPETCALAQLPWDLVSALQQRYKVWALEMVDDAERGLEAGERHYKVTQTTNAKSLAKTSNVVPEPVEGIAMPPPKNGPSNEINMGFTDLGATHGMNQTSHSWRQMSSISNPMQAAQAWSDHNAQQMQGGNFGSLGMQQPSFVGCDPEAIKEAVKPLEKKLETLENKMLDKFELAVENLGKQFERQMEKHVEHSQNKFGSDLKDIRTLVQNSQSMLAAQLHNDPSQKMQANMGENSNNMEANMKKQFDELAETLLLRATPMSPRDGGNANQSLDVVTKKIDEFQESLKTTLSRLGGSMTQMMDGWAQHTIQESKAAAFTLHTKMAQLEEAWNTKATEIEWNITSKLDKVMTEGIDGISTTVTSQTKSSFDNLLTSIESAKNVNLDGQNKLEKKLMEFVKNLNQDFSKNVEMGLGVVGNSLRSQLEGLQAAQLSHHHNTEAGISTKVETSMNRMQEKLSSHAQQLTAQAQAHTQKELEKHLVTMLERVEKGARGQTQSVEEMQLTMRDVRAGTEECNEKLLTLYEHLGVSEDRGGRSGAKFGRQISTAGSRQISTAGSELRGMDSNPSHRDRDRDGAGSPQKYGR
jgi:hypothetical protein